MREILFKAKTTKKSDPNHALNETWVTGNFIMANEKYYIHPVGAIGNVIVIHEIQPDTLCQHTGLTDMNGNKIWENDIVDIREHSITVNGLYKVIYCAKNHCYALKRSDDFHNNFFTFSELNGFDESSEVVGNKFDNPELCEEV